MSYGVTNRENLINTYGIAIDGHQQSINKLSGLVKLLKKTDPHFKTQHQILQQQAERLLYEVSKTEFQVAKIPCLKNRTTDQKNQINLISSKITSLLQL